MLVLTRLEVNLTVHFCPQETVYSPTPTLAFILYLSLELRNQPAGINDFPFGFVVAAVLPC